MDSRKVGRHVPTMKESARVEKTTRQGFGRIREYAPTLCYFFGLCSLAASLYIACNAAFQFRYQEACAIACAGVISLVAFGFAGVICETLNRKRKERSR